jgi:hypothetical protein
MPPRRAIKTGLNPVNARVLRLCSAAGAMVGVAALGDVVFCFTRTGRPRFVAGVRVTPRVGPLTGEGVSAGPPWGVTGAGAAGGEGAGDGEGVV